ncbi:hypothetical protein GDO78_015649 [Eleutherodactylus coqui]|uniref:Uncharacterized protein n=1 Tax=Eleutherodactylus coqui TaxID=57060 RepID=A0A8J6B6Z1_ELECQ|nr:hypothetical protein GDO78_015649 [Eleutherodactylus coqui]
MQGQQIFEFGAGCARPRPLCGASDVTALYPPKPRPLERSCRPWTRRWRPPPEMTAAVVSAARTWTPAHAVPGKLPDGVLPTGFAGAARRTTPPLRR